MEGPSTARGRRSKSLSRFPPPTPGSCEFETPRARFVNKKRGTGQVLFPDSGTGGTGGAGGVSLDDLADEFLRARAESEEDEEVFVPRGRSERRTSLSNSNSSNKGSESSSSGARYLRETTSSKLRDRSVSRPPPTARRTHQSVEPTRSRHSSVSLGHNNNNNNNPKPVTVRKPSTVTSEGPVRQSLLRKQTNSNGGITRKPSSQKDFFLSQDSSSTHSSLTDEEARDTRSNHSNEKTILAVYPTKGHLVSEGEGILYEAMRIEVRNAVEEIRTQLEKVMTKPETTDNKTGGNDDGIQPVQVIAELRRNYTSKLEESEMRKQELLAELAAEEQRGNELTKIVKELLPTPQKNLPVERHSRTRRRSRERTKVSRNLTEEAERYFEDFLSNETDFSSFDGERSDTSFNPKSNYSLQEFQGTPLINSSPKPNFALQELQESPVLSDGVVLPWLQWETTPSPSKTLKEGASAKINNVTTCSHESWSSENGNKSVNSISTNKSISKIGEITDHANKIKKSSYCKEDYLDLRNSEEFLFERLRLSQRRESGSLVLCKRIIL